MRARQGEDLVELDMRVGLQDIERVHVARRDGRAGIGEIDARVDQLAAELDRARIGFGEEQRAPGNLLIAARAPGAELVGQTLVTPARRAFEGDA